MTNTVYQVVEPLKADAVVKAEEQANIIAERVYTKLKACDWDINTAFPYPTYQDIRNRSRGEIEIAKSQHNLAISLTERDVIKSPSASHRLGEPSYRARCAKGLGFFVECAKRDAAAQYELFALKLANKIGEHTDAKLDGNHVWSESILTVTKPDGTEERWKTKTIINVSKLGKLFNQWPSRKVK